MSRGFEEESTERVEANEGCSLYKQTPQRGISFVIGGGFLLHKGREKTREHRAGKNTKKQMPRRNF